MKILSGILSAFLLLSVLFVVSCKDDEEDPLDSELLVANPWNLSALDIRITQAPLSLPIDGYEEMNECSKDDLFDFQDNGQLEVLENTNVCSNSNGGVIATGNWTLTASTLQLTSDYFSNLLDEIGQGQSFPFQYDRDNFDFEVVKLNNNVMELFFSDTYTDPTSPSNPYTIEVNITFDAVIN